MRIRAYGVAWLRLRAESRRHVLIDFDGKAVNRVPSRRILKSSRTRLSTPLSRRPVVLAATDSSAVVTRSSVPVSRVHLRRGDDRMLRRLDAHVRQRPRAGRRGGRAERELDVAVDGVGAVDRTRAQIPASWRGAQSIRCPRNAAKPGEKRPILQESRLGTDVPFVAAPGPHRRGGTGAPPSPPRRGALDRALSAEIIRDPDARRAKLPPKTRHRTEKLRGSGRVVHIRARTVVATHRRRVL
jgi:hypothetical protein